MIRRVYLVCQKNYWNKGPFNVLSDGDSRLLYVFAGAGGLKLAKEKADELNKDRLKNPVHVRAAWIDIGRAV